MEKPATVLLGQNQPLFEKSKAIMLIIDPDTGSIINANPAACSFYGFDIEEFSQKKIQQINRLSPKEIENEMAAARNEKRNYFNFKHMLKNGEIKDVEVYSNPFESEGKTWLFSIIHDISPQYKAQRELDYRVHHNILTELPNQFFANFYIENLIRQASSNNQKFALFLLDLDNWKKIKDTYDHSIAERLIKQLAKRLKNAMGSKETLVHFGSDVFLIILGNYSNIEALTPILTKIQEEVVQEFLIDQHLIKVKGSIGIVLYPASGNTVKELIQNVTISVHRAKKENPGGFDFYNKEMHQEMLQKTYLENQLSRAITNNEFQLYYQPIIDIRKGIVSGFEALVRWNHPEKGLLAPDSFISLAEKTKLISQLDRYVFQNACSHKESFFTNDSMNYFISVNMSSHNFMNSALIKNVEQILDTFDVNPERFIFEITESSMMNDIKKSSLMMQELNKLGIRIAIDDFGTGFSSLNYLASLPFDIIKIDKSFLDNIPHDQRAISLICSIQGIAKGLEKDVVVEGVENADQLQFLYDAGISQTQGYYFGVPAPLNKINEKQLTANILELIQSGITEWVSSD